MTISSEQLRDLAGRAEAMAAEIRALCDSAPEGAPEREALRGARHAADWLDRGGEDLKRSAGDLARLRSLRKCGIPWGVCPEHGNTLSYSVNVTTCKVCGRTWERNRVNQPCQETATWKVTDRAGTVTTMCDGHVLGARATGQGVTFTRLDA